MRLSEQEKLIIKILRAEPDTKEAVLNLIESFGCSGASPVLYALKDFLIKQVRSLLEHTT